MHWKPRLPIAVAFSLVGLAQTGPCQAEAERRTPPNILIAMADDWSWPHTGAQDPTVVTPTLDRLVAEGVTFRNAFVPAPTCTASRGSVLTGRWPWQLDEGANLWSTLPSQFSTAPDLLAQAGYVTGHSDKGWGPGDPTAGGRTTPPAGPNFASFSAFLQARTPGTPFCFWLGPEEPHRPYVAGSGLAAGKDPAGVVVPTVLPDDPIVRSDLCDYYLGIERFDSAVGAAIALLEQAGELNNTVVIMTSDNGLPFPRCKANLYDLGTHVPLVVRWGDQIATSRAVDDFINLADLAPTLLDIAGLTPPGSMTARSFYNVLLSPASGQIDPTRTHVFLARERHTPGQQCYPWGYPSRAVRTSDFLYIVNYEPNRWPAGVPSPGNSYTGVPYSDVDGGPTKTFMVENPEHPAVAPLFALAFGKRPRLELYDLQNDPDQIDNVAGQAQFAAIESTLATLLDTELILTGDPRLTPAGEAFDRFPYYDPSNPAPPLLTDGNLLSIATGGVQVMTLDATPAHAGKTFLMLGSTTSGTLPLPGEFSLPFNGSPYLNMTLMGASPFLNGAWGVLDSTGRATVNFRFEAGAVPTELIGTFFRHAFLVFDAPESSGPLWGGPRPGLGHTSEEIWGSLRLVSNSCGVLLLD